MPSLSLFYSLSEAFAVVATALSIDEITADNEITVVNELLAASNEGKLTFTGRRRKGLQLGDREPIPKDYFADSVNLNREANCIEADASVKDFTEFERNQGLSLWEEVKVAVAAVEALEKSIKAKASSTAGAESRCKKWLIEQMQLKNEPMQPKPYYKEKAVKDFGLGLRAFDRAWFDAIKYTDRHDLSKSGRRPKKKSSTPVT